MQNMPDSLRQRRMDGQDYRESSTRVRTGFLAQEVERTCQDLNFDFTGLHVPESAVDSYGLAYDRFVPLLVKGMQEQQALIDAQATRQDAQQTELGQLKKQAAENAALRAQVEALGAQLEAQAALLKKVVAALQTAGIGEGF